MYSKNGIPWVRPPTHDRKHKKEHSCFLHINALTLFYYKIVLSVVPYKLEFD